MENNVSETLNGYVMDAACVRKSPRRELMERAKVHTRDCGLTGHCAESRFVLIDETGAIALLDDAATLMVVDAIRRSERSHGIKLRARRDREGETMRTSRVEEIVD
jgi:hypothetical protein